MPDRPGLPAHWGRVTEVFGQCLALPASARGPLLEAEVPPVREEVRSLLVALEREDGRFSGNVLGMLPVTADALARDTLAAGTRVGAYEVVRELGRGGMGVVYEAFRVDDDFRKRVAIKVVGSQAQTEGMLRRFRRERRILAQLEHPNIAVLLDGGLSDRGVPWLAMEFVDGVPIDRYVEERRLPRAGRLALLRQVCDALQYAHQRLVVHRDLKPGNILVTAEGTVKLLDFGVAKILSDDASGGDETELGVRPFTPAYAAPEQILGAPLTTACDIHGLGLVMYQVLTGRHPWRTAGMTSDEVQRRIVAMEAPPASLGADLDAMLALALAKEPTRRYPSAGQVAEDLQRYAAGLPVTARRVGAWEQVRRFIRRHRAQVAAAAVALLALLGAVVQSQRAAARATREQARTAQVNAFLRDILASPDPDASGRDVTVLQVLSRAARDLESSRLAPDIEADLRHTIASSYYGLGAWDSSAVQSARAHALRQQVLGDADPRTADALRLRAVAAEALGENQRAESLVTAAVAWHRRAPVIDSALLADALFDQSRIAELVGRTAQAESLQRAVIAMRRGARDTTMRRGLPYALGGLATNFTYQGRLVEAESLLREAVRIEAGSGDTTRPRYREMQRELADLLETRGKYDEADSLMRQVIPALEQSLGPTHTTYLRALSNAARLRLRRGDAAGAVDLARQVAGQIGGALPENDPTAASVLQFLGAALDTLGRSNEAEQALRRAWALRRQSMPAGHWAIASAEATVGAHLLLVGRLRDAEPLLLRGYEGVVREHGPAAPYSTAIARRLVQLYERAGDGEQAAQWKPRAASP